MSHSYGRLSAASLAEKRHVEILVLAADAIQAEVLLGELAGNLPLLGAQIGVGEKAENGRRKFTLVAGCNQRSALLIDQLGVASNVVRNHRQARGHGFEDYIRQTLGIRGENGDVRGSKNGGDIAAIAEEEDAVAEAQDGRLPLDFGTQRTIAHQQEFRGGHALVNLGSDAQKAGMILVMRIHARDHDDPGRAGWLQRGRGELKCRGRQGVSDDSKLLARNTGSSQAIRSRLRVAHYGIAPPESSGLRAKLRGSHQVSQLAMAADDNRDAGKASRRDQCEVHIEIKSVRHLDLMLAEVTTQREART